MARATYSQQSKPGSESGTTLSSVGQVFSAYVSSRSLCRTSQGAAVDICLQLFVVH